jgi:hypothetical protein
MSRALLPAAARASLSDWAQLAACQRAPNSAGSDLRNASRCRFLGAGRVGRTSRLSRETGTARRCHRCPPAGARAARPPRRGPHAAPLSPLGALQLLPDQASSSCATRPRSRTRSAAAQVQTASGYYDHPCKDPGGVRDWNMAAVCLKKLDARLTEAESESFMRPKGSWLSLPPRTGRALYESCYALLAMSSSFPASSRRLRAESGFFVQDVASQVALIRRQGLWAHGVS